MVAALNLLKYKDSDSALIHSAALCGFACNQVMLKVFDPKVKFFD